MSDACRNCSGPLGAIFFLQQWFGRRSAEIPDIDHLLRSATRSGSIVVAGARQAEVEAAYAARPD